MKRREAPRFPLSTSVTILDKKGKNTLSGTAENVSEKGFLFLPNYSSRQHIEEFLYPKMSVIIKKEGKETLGEIKWCEKDLKDSTHLGIWLEAPIRNIGVPSPEGKLDKNNKKKFSKNIASKVKFTQNRSLYKYLSELLDFADQFICSDIGYIGYVISHPDPEYKNKIIAISHTAHVGGKDKEKLKKEYQRHKSVNVYESLEYFQVDPSKRERRKRTCMAHCFKSKKPYLLHHKDNKHMNREEKKAKKEGYFAHFSESITAELTVPIVVDGEVKVIMNFETTVKDAPTFNKISRELLWIFAKKVALTFKDAIFDNDKTFLSLFYHAAVHQIMGQYSNAANEFDTWRQVQCQKTFNKYPYTKVLFSRFREFYKYLGTVYNYKEYESENTFTELKIEKLFRGPDRLEGERSEDRDNNLEYGFPIFALLNTYNQIVQIGGDRSLEARWRDRTENIYHLIIDKKKKQKQDILLDELPEPKVTKLPNGKVVTGFKDIYDGLFAEKKMEFARWRNKSFGDMNEETFFDYYLNFSFIIGITKIIKIQEVLKTGNNFNFEEFKATNKDDIIRLKDIIICCSTLILWEDIRLSKKNVKKKKKKRNNENEHNQISVPTILAYLYRGEAYLLLDEKRKAYNDFSLLERLIETCDVENPNWLPAITVEDEKHRGEDFRHWLKVLLKHQKGKVYFAAFAHRKALVTFCGMMEKYNEFRNNPFGKEIPFQYTIVEAMLYKGKLFLDIGSFQRSLKWFLKGIIEILQVEHESGSLRDFSLYHIAERLLGSLIDKLEEFKHNAIIKKGELIDKLWIPKEDIQKVSKEINNSEKKYKEEKIEKFITKKSKESDGKPKILLTNFLFANFKKPTESCNARLLSDLCNRIGFVLFLINLYPAKYSSAQCEEINKRIQLDKNGNNKKLDLASEWIDWAIKFNPDNGFAMFNRWLVDFDRERFHKYTSARIQKEFPITLKQERFYRSFYPIFLHTIHKRFPKGKEPSEPFHRVAYQLSRYLLTYIDDLIKKPAEVYSYLTKKGLLGKKEPLNGLYSLERWSSWAPKLPRPRMFSCRGGGKLLVWNGKGIAIDPGFDFLTNLYGEYFSLEDIDAICITHDHSDHTDDFDAICRLIKEYRRVLGDKKQLVLLVNPGFSQKCSHYFKEAEDSGEVKHVYLLNHDTTIDLDDFCLSIKVLRALHKEQHTKKYAVGLIFQLKDTPDDIKPVLEIGFTSDTRYSDGNTKENKFKRDFGMLASCDMVVANLSHATFRELKGILKLQFNDELYQSFWDRLEKEERSNSEEKRATIRILKWALWYGDEKEISAIQENETLGQQEGKGILAEHLGISGINKVWEQIKEKPSDRIEGSKLMIISEFREELGSFRSKLAQLLNRLSESENARCYTSDIGMAIRFEKNSSSGKYQIKIQCSFCKQDNSLNIGDTPFHPYTFHPPREKKGDKMCEVCEVCVKGDNEGIFYFCENHITGSKGQFLEGIDRYSPLTLE